MDNGRARDVVPIDTRPPVAPEQHAVMDAVDRRAAVLVRNGFRLAQRGALFSAREEFIRALHMISQTLDAQCDGPEHTRALARGLEALKEADDFVPRGTHLETDLDLRGLIRVHRTPVLQDAQLDGLSASDALGRYLTYTQEQLASAVHREPAGSMALYGLARVSSALGSSNPQRYRAAEPKAVSLHQAALLVRPENHMAANELGVLLARYGHYDDARRALEQSLRAAPSRVGWHNLAVVHQRTGQTASGAEARQQAARMARQAPNGDPAAQPTRPHVRWMAPEGFARTGAAPARPPLPSTNVPEPAPRGKISWLPWSTKPE